MNSLERIKAVVDFQVPDRVPVIAQVFGHAANLAEVSLKDYLCNGDLLARCQIQALNHYGYDAVFALMDVNVEAEALGSVLEYRSNQYPFIKSYVGDSINLDNMTLPDPQQAGRMPELLKAARILRQEVGEEVLVVGCVIGPMTLVSRLLGAEKALYLAIDEPTQFNRIMDFATRVVTSFGLAQLEAGVHLPVVFDPFSTPDVIPPQFYREFVLHQLQKVFTVFKKAGSVANWLHTAGPVQSILPYYRQIGVEIANLDYCVDLVDAMETLPQVCFDGNIRSLAFIEDTPEEINAEATRLLKLFDKRGGYILSSGCEIPPESKPENIEAMVAAVRNYS